MASSTSWDYRCENCGHREPLETSAWQCGQCGGAFLIDEQSSLALDQLSMDDRTLWRYHQVLPVPRDAAISLGEGMTPLVAGELAGRRVWFKLDYLLPTGSFKDRGAAVLTAHLRRLGRQRVIVDSSGNAAAAMAGYSAAAGLDCTVYAPATTSPGKLVQARAFGATVIPVEGNREDVASAAQVAAANDPTAFYASHNWHPVFVEGVKTWVFEVHEQLGQQQAGVLFVPTGGGSALVGAARGYDALPGSRPAIVAAQPVACAPVDEAVQADRDIEPVVPGTTIAEGTRIGAPARPRQILSTIKESGGWSEAVSEEEIIAALRILWSQGFYVEPTGAVGAAACLKSLASGRTLPDGEIVVLLTGSGLKATDAIGAMID